MTVQKGKVQMAMFMHYSKGDYKLVLELNQDISKNEDHICYFDLFFIMLAQENTHSH